jgi:2-polyprenyl-3-methyl-5-hydroxy-6-metoxy-1,4-benzoquinol methylase
MLINYLKTITPFSSVLEVGCGFGRITKLILSNFPKLREYLAVDLSPDQVENAKEYIKDVSQNNNVNLKYIVSDIQSLNAEKKFDLVIASEVFLHILPNEIDQVMRKLVGMTKKNIINLDAYEKVHKELAPHNFIHQYEQIYRNIPSIINVKCIPIIRKGLFSKVDSKQFIFHAEIGDELSPSRQSSDMVKT